MKEEIKIKTYDEWLKYYENATKEDVIYDLTRDVEYFADAVKDIKQLQEENKSLQSQLKAKEEMVKVMGKYFELIIDLGFDYDGFNKADSLKGLIDELVRFAKLGRACNITEAIYEIENKKFNILYKEILSKGENNDERI